MKIQKKAQEKGIGKEKIEEEYWFVQEAVRPYRRHQAVRIVQRLLLLVVCAAIFGVTGGAAFQMTQTALMKREEAKARDALFSDMEHGTEDTGGEAQGAGSSGLSSAYEQYWKKMADIGKKCNRSIVGVSAGNTESWYQRGSSQDEVQSGILFHEKGKRLYILTSNTAIIRGKSLNVEFINEDTVQAELVKEDDLLGVAVLAVSAEDITEGTREDIRLAELVGEADELNLELSENILAVGNPDGNMYSVIPGNIVNTELSAGIPDGELSLYSTNINFHPNGDGFAVDADGRVVGMVTGNYNDASGGGGCVFVAASDIAGVAMRLAEGKDTPSLGISGCDAGKEEDGGVYVEEVAFQSPAYEGGIRVADVIAEVDGYRIGGIKELRLALLTHDSGDEVKLRVERGSGKKTASRELEVVLE